MKQKTKSPLAVRLISTRIAKLNFEAIKPPSDKDFELEITLEGGFDFVSKDKTVSVLMVVAVSGQDAPFTIEIHLEGVFLVNRKATKKDVEPLARINCNAILFPYIRETIAEITRRAGYRPLHLQSVNFVQLFEQTEEQKPNKRKDQKAKSESV